MKAYPTYKDSGVSWLGVIPSSWNVTQYRAYFSERNTPNTNLVKRIYYPLAMGK